MKLQNLAWIASVFSIIGTVLNANIMIWCWPVWICGNFIWMYWAWKQKMWPQVFNMIKEV